MTLPDLPSDANGNKSHPLNENAGDLRVDCGSPTSKIARPLKPTLSDGQNGFLSAPLLAPPIRPVSPDTISNLSLDEYDQLRRSISGDAASSPATVPTSNVRAGWRGKVHQFWIRNKGLAYMLLGQIFGVLMNVTTRLLEVEGNKGKGLHPFQILFARMGITFFLATGYMWYSKTPHFPLGMPEVRLLLIARGLGGFFGVFGMYYSLLYLPLADATVITFLAPGLACWACAVLLKQPFTRTEQIAGLISLVGVVLIARPTTFFTTSNSEDSMAPAVNGTSASNHTAPAVSDASSYANVTPVQRLTAIGIALIGVLGSALVYIIIRWIGKRAHPLITVNYFAGWCFFVSTVAQFALPGVGWLLPADLKEWGYLLFLGVCGFVMQFLLAAGLAYEKSSRATNMVYSSMIFALIADKVLFGHTPGMMSIFGSSLILGSAIIVATQQDPSALQGKENAEGDAYAHERRTGLLGSLRDEESGRSHDRLPLQELQIRALI